MLTNAGVFVDSGAHSLYTREVMSKGFRADNYGFYESDAFWQYVDEYAAFIKENKESIRTYVNVDVIFNNEMSWKVQKYLEDQHGLNPLPVFHSGKDQHKWLMKYLDNYDYIGMGGLGQQSTKSQWMRNMGDPVFSTICKAPDFLPSHKIHGFAMTSPSLLAAYPWYSVDSTSWIQFGKFGMVIIPRKKNGKYQYKEAPYIACVSSRPGKKGSTAHIDNFVDMHQDYFADYFAESGHVMGSSEFKTVPLEGYKLQTNEQWAARKEGLVEVILVRGLCNDHSLRDELNLRFYIDLEASIPAWPHPWHKRVKTSRLF